MRPDNPSDVDIEDVVRELTILEETVTSPEEQRAIRRTRRLTERIPGGRQIQKYTGRDITESAVGGVAFSLPLLVEDGVFDIAAWFTTVTFGPVPVFLALNILFVVALTAAVLFGTDFREVAVTRPFFGIIPRRLVGVLTVSFVVAGSMLFLWGRLHEGDPGRVEQLGRITILWAAAGLGATLGDLLPGESRGRDLGAMTDSLRDR